MIKIILICASVVALGLGMASCSTSWNLFGCYNPTGYCGGKSSPDPDRIGGPSWFLWQASAEERLAYYQNICKEDQPLASKDVKSCAIQNIRQNAHHYCVLYNLPPTRPKDDAEEAARNNNYENCKKDVLGQYGL